MEDLYKRLLEFTRDGVYRYTWEDGRILMANQGLVDILDLDCSPGALVGKLLRDVIIYTEEEGTIRHSLEKSGEVHGFEYHFKTLNGRDKWVLHDSLIVKDPDTGEKIAEAIVKDITERKHVEEELCKAHEVLAQSHEELRRLNELKSGFISAVSHEFRTPLTIIRSFSDIMAKKKLGEVNDRQLENLRTVVKQADHLSDLVTNLLDLNTIEAGKMELKMRSLSAAEFIEDVVAALAPLAAEKGVSIKARPEEGLGLVEADEHCLTRILNNLVGNAVKFTSSGGTVTVRAFEAGGMVEVDVEDDGTGIPGCYLAEIFDEFFRGPTERARQGWGAGLGLAIVKNLVEQHGGSVRVHSELGKGSMFAFTLRKAAP